MQRSRERYKQVSDEVPIRGSINEWTHYPSEYQLLKSVASCKALLSRASASA
jgi:hypothetical protein